MASSTSQSLVLGSKPEEKKKLVSNLNWLKKKKKENMRPLATGL